MVGDKLMRHSEIQLQMILVEFDEIVGPTAVGDKSLPHGSICRSSPAKGMSTVASDRRQNQNVSGLRRTFTDGDRNPVTESGDVDLADCRGVHVRSRLQPTSDRRDRIRHVDVVGPLLDAVPVPRKGLVMLHSGPAGRVDEQGILEHGSSIAPGPGKVTRSEMT